MADAEDRKDREPLGLKDALTFALEEARVVVPGIQALFGFQLIAVFNNRFDEVFGETAQRLHLAALVLVALSCMLLLTPSALHRLAGQEHVSRDLLHAASRFIGWGMVPLMAAISIDVGLIGYVVTGSETSGTVLGLACGAVGAALWFAFPRWARRRHGQQPGP
jgi:L-lactate permease